VLISRNHSWLISTRSRFINPLTSVPIGVGGGGATISKWVRKNGHYEWHLSKVKRLPKPRKPKGRPQPVWFKPSDATCAPEHRC
jgi:hypothetical protein